MSIAKVLPIARKMGEENFLAYKQYMKTIKAGKSASLTMNLKDTTIVDTLSFTVRKGQAVDVEGFRNLLREIHKKYFPRAGSGEATKKVTLEHNAISEDNKTTLIETTTSDKNGVFANSIYSFITFNKKLTAHVDCICEDFRLNFFGIFNLKSQGTKDIPNLSANLPKGLKFNDCGKKVQLSINALATEEVPIFELNAELSKEKFEKIFGGELEQALPDLIEKSGMKMF